MTILEWVALVTLISWLLLAVDRSRRWPAEGQLPAPFAGQRPAVTAIVPARNEAELLPQTLPSLLQQEGVDLRVILVDDGSTDGTADAARQAARDCGRGEQLRIVRAGPTPKGWGGKVHALDCGLRALLDVHLRRGPEIPSWLLLTDADIRHRQGVVAALWAQAHGAGGGASFDLVSIMARLPRGTISERLLLPPFVFFFHLLYPFRRVSQPRSRVAAAAGGCVLVRRQALERAGGFEGIRSALIDDVALAARVKRAGGHIWLGFDRGVRSLRRYPRLNDLWRLVTRTAFTQLGYRWSLLVVTLLGLMIFVVSPPAVIGAAGLRGWIFELAEPWATMRATTWATLTWMLQARALWPAVRHHDLPVAYAASLPLAGLLFALMTGASAWRHLRGRGPEWRGRVHETGS